MKNFFTRFPVFSLLVVMGMLFAGCVEPEPVDPVDPNGSETNKPGETGKPSITDEFTVTVNQLGPDFVELRITAPSEVEMAYVLGTSQQAVSPAVLFATGKTLSIKPGETFKLTENIMSETTYYLYAAAKLDEKNYSKVVTVEFTTLKYEFTELITIVETYYDGYKAHITVPQETKDRGHVIRAGSMPLAWYYLMTSNSSTAEIDLQAIASNGDPYTGHMFNDSTIIWNDDNVVLMDENGEPVIDSNGEMFDIHNPMVPGEPTIIFAGECRYGSAEDFNAVMGYYQPERDSWSVPYYDKDAGQWLGAFQKKEFFTKEPTLCDCTFNVDIPEDEITVTDAMVYFEAGDGVSSYFYMILDNSTYNAILGTYLNNREEWYQWFLTSYIAFYEWGVYPQTTSSFTNAGASFTEPLTGGDTYHVLVTVLGDELGATQRFIHKTFTTHEKTKVPPVIEINAVQENDPYVATFNIKAPNKDLAGSYWACNYARDFEVMFNAKYTYEQLLKGNYTFTSEELAAINSDEGLTVSFPTLDGEVTRFAAYGCNDEYTFNNIDPEVEGKGWADYNAPMAQKKDPVSSDLFAALEGEWTATATIIAKEVLEDGSEVSRNLKHSSVVTISNSAPAVPESLDASVYELYPNNDKEDVDGMFDELHFLTDQFTEYRLEGQNRLLCSGFVDFDYYNPGRMDLRTPYDLFTATDYVSIDVPQAIYDFGPKWFLEVRADGSVIVPFDSMFLPPMHNWPMYAKYDWSASTYYVGAVGSGNGYVDANEDYPGFPVEISDDRNTITIKPLVIGSGADEQVCYMNACGVNPQDPTYYDIIATVISDIVLTRTATKATPATTSVSRIAPSKVKAMTLEGKPMAKMPVARKYKSMTKLEPQPLRDYVYDETPNVVTMEMVEKTSAKILNYYKVK